MLIQCCVSQLLVLHSLDERKRRNLFAARLRELDPLFRLSRLEEYLGPYRPAAFREKYREGLRMAGLPE